LQSLDKVLLEKITDSQIVKKFPPPNFMEPKGSLSCLLRAPLAPIMNEIIQVETFILFLENSIEYCPPTCACVSKWFLSLRFPKENSVCTSPLPHSFHRPYPSNS